MADDNKSEETKEEEESKDDSSSEDSAKEETPAKEEDSAKEESSEKVKVSGKVGKLMDEIEKLSVLELSELVHALEDKFGVSASAGVAMAAPAGGGAAGESADEAQTTFNVVLAEAGANKISVIKTVREIDQNLGLKEAKDLVDAAPKPILEGVNKETAQEAKTKLEAAGAKVELK